MGDSISIKGTREGLTITLGSGDLDRLYNDLNQHLDRQGAFFRGGLVALEVGNREIDDQAIIAFRDLIDEHAMVLRTVVATNGYTQQAAKKLGLRTVTPETSEVASSFLASSQSREQTVPPPDSLPPTPQEEQASAISQAGARGLVVRRRLRAGQTIRHTGSIVVIGDVNVGAEIIAGGDVVVWGRLRGTVHAGYLNNTSAVVCALDFGPIQLRIGNLITRPDEGAGERGATYPEVAYVRQDSIVVERWSGIQWRD